MFLGEDRLPVVRRMILADTPEEEAAALEELRVVQKADFVEILEAMDGLPVTVRLLDPPLHEFLPDVEELEIKKAHRRASPPRRRTSSPRPRRGTSSTRCSAPAACASACQARPLRHAGAGAHGGGRRAGARRAASPIVEIMIPLTVTREELAEARGWVEEAIAEATAGQTKKPIDVTIGTMIETPRAALRADEIAEEADFFSLRHQRPHADDLRVQPRRRRGPDDAGLPRGTGC